MPIYQENLQNILLAMYQIIAQWVTINEVTKELYMPLVDASYVLMNEVCRLLRIDLDYVIDTWEKAGFEPDKAVDMIIADRFERVEEK